MTYSYLMKSLLDTKKYDEVITVFDSALDVDSRVVRNIGLYTTAITAAARMRNFDKAMAYIGKMKGEGITPNTKALTSLVNACVMCGKPDVGLEVYEGMKERGLGEDSRAKLTIVRAYVQLGRWDDAMGVLQGGKSGGKDFKGNEIMEGYEQVLKGMTGEGEWTRAREGLETLLRYGFIPSRKIMVGIMRGCNVFRDAGGNTEDVLRFLFDTVDMLGERKIPISGSLYAYLLHRIADLVYSYGWESEDAKVFMEVGKAVRGAKLRDNTMVGAGNNWRRGEVGEVWGGLVEVLREEEGRKADDLMMGSMRVRVGGDEVDKVGTAERRIARVSGAGRGRRAEV
jgi:pentatricopeptide repeat protein